MVRQDRHRVESHHYVEVSALRAWAWSESFSPLGNLCLKNIKGIIMKIDFGETELEKIRRLEKPHKWFAWYPVEVGPRDHRWLEYVERTGRQSVLSQGCWFWTYKAIPKTVGDYY